MPSASDAVRRARAYLLRVAEPPAPALIAFVDRHGPMRAAALVAGGEVPDAVRDETAARRHRDLAEADLASAARVGARLVIPEDDDWPTARLAILSSHGGSETAPPVALWVRGSARLADLVQDAVGVVGARAASSYGETVATQFGYDLATAGQTVVSGLAYGIGAATHRGALAADGRTMAVLACGVDVDYPSANTNLRDRITGCGLILSEYPPGTTPDRRRSAARGRLLAALTAGTVIVEAGPRSGALTIAATTRALGQPVMIVPGPITSTMSLGCHDLLRHGDAIPVTSVPDILESVRSSAGHGRVAPSRLDTVAG